MSIVHNPTQRRHVRAGMSLSRLLTVAAVSGLAIGVGTMTVLARQQDQPEPAKDPAKSPEDLKKQEAEKQRMENEKAKLLKRIQEERAKFPVDEKKANLTPSQPGKQPPAKTPPKPAHPQPAAPVTTPGALKPASTPSSPAGATTSPGAEPAKGDQEATPAPMPNPAAALGDKDFLFNFTDETELTIIVQYLQEALHLQMIVQDGGGLAGQKIRFMTPISVPKEQAIPFLTMLLEQRDYTIVRNNLGIYIVQPKNQIGPIVGNDPSSTTRIIQTPGLKPTALLGPITSLIASGRGGGAGAQPVFLDDLGVIVMTDTPHVISVVEEFIAKLVDEQQKLGITRFPVNNIAAAAARDRVLEFLGDSSGAGGGFTRPRVPGQPVAPSGPASTISNLPDRLMLDPSTNALLFRGRPDEVRMLASLLPLVDVPNEIEARWYPIGMRAAEMVTDWARRLQLGDVTYFESSDSQGFGGGGTALGRVNNRAGAANAALQPGQPNDTASSAGAGFVVYPDAGGFMYRGTAQQHAKVKELIDKLGPLSEYDDTIVYEFYKLRHSKADEVANTINDLINNQASTGNRGGLLGRDLGNGNRRSALSATERTKEIQRRLSGDQTQQPAGAAGAGGITEINSEDVFVLADEQNNQVVVKAPKRLQAQVKSVIDRLDLRRPQVFIEAKVVAITTGSDFRLAVEVQQIIGQFALTTNFGLSSIGDAGSILTKKTVTTGQGLTAALVRSQDVPFIIDALSRDTDARVVSAPQVLVDDNQEAEIESKDAQPTQTTTIGSAGQQNVQSFGGYEEAGPKLTVKPQISEGGYMRLEYEVELSSFTGEGSNGSPPPKQTNRLKSESVTVPSDTTIIVGGLAQEFRSKNVTGIPLLKDIPIVGELFKDTRTQTRNVTLYVFITPKIMRDPSFADLRLLTKMPLSSAGLEQALPAPTHDRIDLSESARLDTENKLDETISEQREKYVPEDPNRKYKRKEHGMVN